MTASLRDLLTSRQAAFAALAQAWLDTGATAFGVFERERPLAIWPADSLPDGRAVIAPIMVAEAAVADLRVEGLSGPEIEARLGAEPALVRDLIVLEDELYRMTGDLVERQDHLLAVYDLADHLRRHLTLDRTLSSVAAEARRLIRAERSCVIFAPAGAAPMVVYDPAPPAEEAFLWQTFYQMQSADHELLLPSRGFGERLPPALRGLWLMPIRLRGQIVGALGLINPAEPAQATELRLAQAIADLSSGQIDTVLLYQESIAQARLNTEMELARRVQLNLLPQRLPQVPGLEIAAGSRPALQVGGDFYDFVARADQPLIFCAGDVSGKGLSAALLMTMARTAIRSKASFMPGPTPARVLRQSNEDLYDDFARVGMFATVFIGQYDPELRRLQFANAGQAPVIYRPARGRARLLIAEATAMGVLTDLACPDSSVALGPGDLLVVGTDGLSDARDPNDELFGHERLLNLIDYLAERSAPEIAEALFATVDRFAGGRLQGDDQTLVVLRGADL